MKNILFHCWADEAWMGGVYYIRNMMFALLQNRDAKANLRIYVLVKSTVANVFEDFLENENVSIIFLDHLSFTQRVKRRVKKIWYKNIMRKQVQGDLTLVVNKYKIDYIYPVCYREEVYVDKGITWIPDFQHIHYPGYFPGDSLRQREEEYEYFAKNHKKLVLSSNSAKKDYLETYPQYADNIYVIPFVSAIESKIMCEDRIENVKYQYGITGRYFLVSNQFWKHKNHKIILEALCHVKRKGNRELLVVCTGKLEDLRDPSYTKELNEYILENDLTNNFKILGLIDREEQLQLMKGCIAVLQPSLFEGWGTVVEDAKTLRKKIILSDIDVHLEQANTNCTLYDRNDSQQLAEIMLRFWNMDGGENDESDFDYVKQATEYGQLFYDMLQNG